MIYILFPIESLTTKRCYDILKDVKFKIYIPNYRIGFIVDNKQYRAGAFGICILHLQDENDIKLITREEIEV